jgi:threonyl-tRNA synthetase
MEANDHRALGQKLELFHLQPEGPGQVFWHPRGFAIYRVIEDYIRKRMREAGFREVRTPQLLDRDLWVRSGHWEKFGAEMFWLQDDNRSFALKPMSCPGHIQIFGHRPRSWRELPVRFAEFGACHRNEASGALLGLMRTRAFVQDDAHVFCTEAQIEAEVARFCLLLKSIYADFGFPDFIVGFSTRPELRAGSDATWDRAEAALAAAGRAAGLAFRHQPGDGTFYGPKLEFVLTDARGRDWQCGTVQLDFVQPERFDLGYVDSGNAEARPVMIHHAVLGSVERFLAILLEHHGGELPLWLAPDQVSVMSIADAHADYARKVAGELEARGVRVVVDDRSERLPRKIVDAREQGIPVMLVVGTREAQEKTVALRRGHEQRSLPLAEAVEQLAAEGRR